MPSTITITPVPAAHHRLVARLLARAFADDPVSLWMMPDEARLERGFDFYARRIWRKPHWYLNMWASNRMRRAVGSGRR